MWFQRENHFSFRAFFLLCRSVWLTLKEHIMSIYSGYTFHYSIYEYGCVRAQWHTFSPFFLRRMQQLFCVFSHPTNLSSHRKTPHPTRFYERCTTCAHKHMHTNTAIYFIIRLKIIRETMLRDLSNVQSCG